MGLLEIAETVLRGGRSSMLVEAIVGGKLVESGQLGHVGIQELFDGLGGGFFEQLAGHAKI